MVAKDVGDYAMMTLKTNGLAALRVLAVTKRDGTQTQFHPYKITLSSINFT